jgi:hypothetical protein
MLPPVTEPFLPILKAKNVMCNALLQLPHEPTVPKQCTAHFTLHTYAAMLWASPWQVRRGARHCSHIQACIQAHRRILAHVCWRIYAMLWASPWQVR